MTRNTEPMIKELEPLLVGDCLGSLRLLSAGSVHTCVTSPPYFGLRDYGHDGQIGLEETPAQFVAKLVAVFAEVQRVLRDDGTLWLNLGDSWKNKQLLGVPWRVALALQDFGWYLRQELIWDKPNQMPENVPDRCTKSHEHIFLLSKSAHYYFDQCAIREPAVQAGRVRNDRFGGNKYGKGVKHSDGSMFTGSDTRNRRSVWTVPTRPFRGAHFATFPEQLIEPCILAGAPAGGVVLDPFMGAGTTAVVAERLGRQWVGCELNPTYADMALDRIAAARAKA